MARWCKDQNSLLPEQLLKQLSVIASNLICSVEQDGIGVGGRGVHLSPWIHQDYPFRHRSACRKPAESGQEYLTRGKDYIDHAKLSRMKELGEKTGVRVGLDLQWVWELKQESNPRIRAIV